MRAHFAHALAQAGVALSLRAEAVEIVSAGSTVRFNIRESPGTRRVTTRFLFNCSYARLNYNVGVLLNYVHDGYVDHAAYVKDRGIRFLAELRNYNRDPGVGGAWIAWKAFGLESRLEMSYASPSWRRE